MIGSAFLPRGAYCFWVLADGIKWGNGRVNENKRLGCQELTECGKNSCEKVCVVEREWYFWSPFARSAGAGLRDWEKGVREGKKKNFFLLKFGKGCYNSYLCTPKMKEGALRSGAN